MSGDFEDTASASGTATNQEASTADRIRRLREEEERERRVREEAWNAGVFSRGGESVPIDGDVTSRRQGLSSTGVQVQAGLEEGNNGAIMVSEENGLEIDLNVGMLVGKEAEAVMGVDQSEHALTAELGHIGQTQPVSLTQGSDPFNLGPLIARGQPQPTYNRRAVMGKRRREESNGISKEKRLRVNDTTNVGWRGRTTTSRELLCEDDHSQEVETGRSGSPRAP